MTHIKAERFRNGLNPGSGKLDDIELMLEHEYTWDSENNLVQVEDQRPESDWPAGHKPQRTTITHDALYRVVQSDYEYKTSSGWGVTDTGTDWRSERTRTNADMSTHQAMDPMVEAPAPMLPSAPSNRVVG